MAVADHIILIDTHISLCIIPKGLSAIRIIGAPSIGDLGFARQWAVESVVECKIGIMLSPQDAGIRPVQHSKIQPKKSAA